MSMAAQNLFLTEGKSHVISFLNVFLFEKQTLTGFVGRRFRHVVKVCQVIATILIVAFTVAHSQLQAAVYKTDNFTVQATDEGFAKQVGEAAESYRIKLAQLWLGRDLPRWSRPCEVSVKTGTELVSAGETVFSFSNGEVYDWKMTVQGSPERILDSVLPHEVTHTIIASYLRMPVPRWLDEGMATAVEASSERAHYRKMLATFLHTKRGIAFDDMVSMKEYPSDLTPFYSQSFSVCEYLILVGGYRRLVEFAKAGVESNDWNAELKRYYDCNSLGALQYEWNRWIREWDLANQPEMLPATRRLPSIDDMPKEIMLAQNSSVHSDSISVGIRERESFGNSETNPITVARGQSKIKEQGNFFKGLTQSFSSRNNGVDSAFQEPTGNFGIASTTSSQTLSVSTNKTIENGSIRRSSESILSNGAGSAVKPKSTLQPYYRSSETSVHLQKERTIR